MATGVTLWQNNKAASAQAQQFRKTDLLQWPPAWRFVKTELLQWPQAWHSGNDRAALMATVMTVSIGLLRRAVGACVIMWKQCCFSDLGLNVCLSLWFSCVYVCVHFWLPRLYWKLDVISCSVMTLWIWIFFAWCWVICKSYYHLMCVCFLLHLPVAMCCIVVLGMGLNWIENDTWQKLHWSLWMSICICCTCREMACGKHQRQGYVASESQP